jgi:Tol biopolymer transport system component
MKGDTFDEPTLVEVLSSPGFFTQRPSISSNGREMFFSSNRPGSAQSDIWTSTRYEGNQWSSPVNLGPIVNSNLQEQTPAISDDGTLLFFASNRERNNFDLYVATRTVVAEE